MSEKEEIKKGGDKKVGEEFKKYLDLVGKGILKFFKELKKFGFGKIIGLSVIIAVGFIGVAETIFALLALIDPLKFQKILEHFYGFKLFDYLSQTNFYLLISSSYILDSIIYVLLIALGFYFGKGKNRLKERKCWIGLVVLGVSSLVVFSYAFYQSMPEILIPLEKIENTQKTHYIITNNLNEEKEGYKIRKEGDGVIKEKDFDDGFIREGYLDKDNEKGYYYEYHYQNSF